MRIFTLSDLHIDYKQNRLWLMQLSRFDYQNDAIIVAGDISDKWELQQLAFKQLVRCFKWVFFVPGNHDLWVGRNGLNHSLEKFQQIMAMAAERGVETAAKQLSAVTVVPLYSWYDGSFGAIDEYLQQRWMDFFLCRWPDEIEQYAAFGEREAVINAHFLALNEQTLAKVAELKAELKAEPDNDTVISFSHFLPRIDVMPSFIPAIHQKLYPVLGSRLLDQQIRRLGATMHIYGHSHVNRHELIDGIEYINNAFANPGEERIARKQLLCIYSDE